VLLVAIDDLQRYVAKMEEERGFAHRDVVSQCLLLGEEVGELFKLCASTRRCGSAQRR
jgi:hypothetical protein